MPQAQTSNFRFFKAFFQISTPIWEPCHAPIATKIGMDKPQSITNLHLNFYGAVPKTSLTDVYLFLATCKF